MALVFKNVDVDGDYVEIEELGGKYLLSTTRASDGSSSAVVFNTVDDAIGWLLRAASAVAHHDVRKNLKEAA